MDGGQQPGRHRHDLILQLLNVTLSLAPVFLVFYLPGYGMPGHGITTREFTHADLLQQVLARDGVPAVVRFGPQCQPAPGEHALPGSVHAKVIRPGQQPGGNPLTVDRDAMPSGTELLINYWRTGWDGAGWIGVTTVRLYPAGTTFVCHAPAGNG